ncbi:MULTISPECIES: hypothetical protein [Deinococcus]|uniref:DUF1918 domain-containing protein n=1 Tax=Deinococcus rufus TaxID=2136097 RepID=A0ABV7ZBK6_9DEIO|nr:hypothetical protein [Deinococcus sp. AB2017081]WQE94065.1 hypothetical protein U2P90_11660 [Deinococcus sp. AB2017081]
MRRDLKTGSVVRVVPGRHTRPAVAALRGQRATVLGWSEAENTYRLEFADGQQRLIHRAELEPA